jgi:hypothetical protein
LLRLGWGSSFLFVLLPPPFLVVCRDSRGWIGRPGEVGRVILLLEFAGGRRGKGFGDDEGADEDRVVLHHVKTLVLEK